MKSVEEYIKYLKLDKSKHTIRSYVSSIDRFFSFLKIVSDDQLAKITSSDCRNFLSYLLENKMQFSSVNAHLRPLKAFFAWLVENEFIEDSPFDKVKALKEQKKNLIVLTGQEIESMMQSCKNVREKAILGVMISTGVRRAELVNIKLSDIDGYTITILGKGNKYRDVYLPDIVLALVNKYLESKKYESEYLFSTPHGKLSEEAIRQMVKRIALRAGIDVRRVKNITPHTMRRSLATKMVAENVNIRTIQGVLGHANVETTMVYAKLSQEAVKTAMRNNNFGNI
jgi:integrase/recombinase XerD